MGIILVRHFLRLFIATLTAVVLLPAIGNAQNKITVERNDTTYYVHQVETGHTLYSISKLYGVTVEDIQRQNPEVLAGLKVGQTLYIEVSEERQQKPDEWSNPIRIEDGMMVHRVKRRENLYRISKQYKTDINRLLELNPGIENGINPGDELLIPPNDLDQPAAPLPQRDSSEVWLKHKVEKGETLYSIAKSYGVSQKALSQLNSDFPDGLKAESVIYIPIRNDQPAEDRLIERFEVTLKDSVFIKERYNVVIMLPLQLDKLDEHTETAQPEAESPRSKRLREIAMSYFRGSLMALDSLKDYGARLHISLLDVSSPEEAQEALTMAEVKDAHLIIGPLQRKALEEVASFSAKRGIHLVCPVPQSNRILLNSPNLSKVYPSKDSEIRALALHVAEAHQADNLVLVNTKNLADTRSVQLFKKYYHEATTQRDSLDDAMTELECSSKFIGKLKSQLDPSKLNVLVVPAGDESQSMIANLQSRIQLLDQRFEVRMYALNDWVSYDFLDYSFKYRTRLTVPGTEYIDYTAPEVVSFIEEFRERFNTEPSLYAYLAYDILLYYGKGLLQYGINFPNRFEKIDQSDLLGHGFDFHKTGLESGFENRHVYLLEHRNFALKPLKEDTVERTYR